MSESSNGEKNPLEPSDEDLMEQYRTQGDERAFAALYKRHAARVYGYLSHRIPGRQELDEVHQAVFLKFHQSRHLYDRKYLVLQWLFVIARTTAVDHLRVTRRSISTDSDAEAWRRAEAVATENSAEHGDLSSLEQLSAREKSAVEMRVLQELPYQEIAEKLGQSETSVRQIVSRALKKLRISLEAKGTAR